MEAIAATPASIPPAAVVASPSSVAAGTEQQQQQLKRKADEASLSAAPAPKTCTANVDRAATATTSSATNGAVAELRTLTKQGSCLEMAIALDSSDSESDIPANRNGVDTWSASVVAATVPTTASTAAAYVIPGARVNSAPGASNAVAATPTGTLRNGLSSHGTHSASGAAAGGGLGVYGPLAGHGNRVKHDYNTNENGKMKSPKVKKRVGRPVGSKNRPRTEDPPYVSTNNTQRTVDPRFAPNAANRPKRQPGPRMRWADEMMNPGEQWLRKTPRSEQPLPPNPVDASIPDAPTFYPTEEQFRDPLSYVELIRPRAESYGIAKIVPPAGWKPPATPMHLHATKRVPTKKQALHSLMNSDEVYDDGRHFTVLEYKMMADKFERFWDQRQRPVEKERALPHYTPQPPKLETPLGATATEANEIVKENAKFRRLEREYWNVVDGGAEEALVEYANDLDISEFWSGFPLPPPNFMDGSTFDRSKPCRFDDPEYYRTCGWNLNNLPFWPGSVLRFFRTHVNGLTAPWMYLGMQFATFAWHNEDNYLYSLNYHHSGAAKQWYGVPGKHSKGFERCLAKVLGETLDTVSEHLYRITKMLSPVYLQEANVPVCRLQQHPGQFVVTFPKAYHGGFSYGFNCGEAVNFAVPDWIAYSRESTEAYRSASRMAALSHDKMVATLTMYLPDHDINGCELVVRELKRIQKEELEHRGMLERLGVQDPARQGVPLPRFRLGLIEQDTEEYDMRRVCKTCKHTLFMTGVACPCSDVDVSCLRCVREACDCPVSGKYLLSWWTEEDLSRFVKTAEAYIRKLRDGHADAAAVKVFRDNINPF